MKSWFSAFLFLLICAAPMSASAQEAADKTAVAHFFRSFNAACDRDDGKLWGETLCGPLLVYDKDRGVVYANEADKEGLLQPEDIYYWSPSVSADDAPPYTNTSADWKGKRWATVRIIDIANSKSALRLALHESFHRIQQDLEHANADADLPDHLDAQEGRTLFRAEMRALRAALDAAADNRKSKVRRHLENALGFRLMRYDLFPGAEEKERALEVHEGLAEYTGWRAAERWPDFRDLADHLAGFDFENSYMRSFAYRTGPAYGLLFDYLDEDWRGRFSSQETSFQSIARRAAGAPGFVKRETYESLQQAFADYDLPALYQEEAEFAREIADRKADYLARFVDGRRLVVPLFQIGFDPQTVMSLDDHGQVYGTLNSGGPWGSINTESGALVVWSERKIYFDRREPEGDAPWESDVWTLTLNEGWRIRDDGRDLIIEKAD